MAHFDRTLVVIVHFLVVVAESLKHCSPEETYKLKKLVYELVKLNPKNSKNSTLIHLASSRDSSSIIKNHTLSSFPSAEVLALLLQCGADPHSLDSDKNSPLHLAAANRHFPLANASSSAVLTANATAAAAAAAAAAVMANGGNLHHHHHNNNNPVTLSSERDKIIFLLLNSGAHLDQCNLYNKTAADLYKNGKLYQVVNPINYVTLQCLCAKVIQKHKIPYKDQLTSKLASFVSIH
jgi:ankyrin repeat protein